MFETIAQHAVIGAKAVAVGCSVGFITYVAAAGPLHWLNIYDPPLRYGAYEEKETLRSLAIDLSLFIWGLAIVAMLAFTVLVTIGYVVGWFL